MEYSEIEVNRLLDTDNLSTEDLIKVNILNFIRIIHINKQNFIESSYRTEFFGELPMTFQKNAGQVIGLITATVNAEVRSFVFNDKGYEPLKDLLKLLEE
jgi:hypothetical protein